MAEFQKVIKERNRMCKANKCVKCPLFVAIGNDFCEEWSYEHPLEAEEIIMKWAKENPLITNRLKFEKVFGVDCTEPILSDFDGWLEQEYEGGQDETD